jgi:short-chain fatty acids transporter
VARGEHGWMGTRLKRGMNVETSDTVTGTPRLPDRVAAFARRAGDFVPDATATAVIMLFALGAMALSLGDTLNTTVDAWYRGLWMLLPFSMQMTLILALSGVISMSSGFRRFARAVADLPRTLPQVIALSIAVTSVISYVYWGLALALGPLIAVYFAESAERKGIRVDFPLLVATTFAAGSVWQYGLSSSAALLMASPGHFLEAETGVLNLGTTIGSLPAMLVILVFPTLLALIALRLMPGDARPISQFPGASALAKFEPPPVAPVEQPGGFSGWTERTAMFPLLLCVALVAWLYHHFEVKAASLDINSMIVMLAIVALLLQRSFGSLGRAMSEAVVPCWRVILLYQLYAGVAGVLQFTSVGPWFAGAFAAIATPLTFPLFTAIGASIIAIFVPSSGGQWIIQGFVTVTAAAELGASPQQALLAIGVGDQMGNLLAPFWLVVAAGIARVDFREIFGYCLVYAALWFAVGVTIFTFVK